MNFIRKRGIKILIVLLAIVALFLIYKQSVEGTPIRLTTCTQAHSEGLYNIPKSSPYYRPQLDRDKDSIACEL